MALGDGIRRNIAKVTSEERDILRKAFIALHTNVEFHYTGKRGDKPFPGGVSYWFKQDEIHQATHVHGGPAFLPWHRELCNRFEKLLRRYDERLSLHYWDWNTDPDATPDERGIPIKLFTDDFMGNADGDINEGYAGEPWLGANFYDPNPKGDRYRGVDPFDLAHSNPFDPPIELKRNKPPGTLEAFIKDTNRRYFSDEDIIGSWTFSEMRKKLESVHNRAHEYIGGTIGDPHTSFRDPFVFLLHSNVDRIFTAWQLKPGFEWRLDPKYIYGLESTSVALGTHPHISVGITTLLSPWAGVGDARAKPGVNDVRPWASPDNWHRQPKLYPDEKIKDSTDPSVVKPRLYDEPQIDTKSFNLCESFAKNLEAI